jgi:hypothetical protein
LTLPAHPGDYLTIYGTGLGNATADQVSVSLAGLPISVTYAGPAPGELGVDQINVLIPAGLVIPDSCGNAFTVAIAGVSSTQPLPYTRTAAVCPSTFGLNALELAAVDSGSPVSFVQLDVYSNIDPATSGSGFTRFESASAYKQPYRYYLEPSNLVDSVLYSCSNAIAGVYIGILPLPYTDLSMSMGSTSIRFFPFGYSKETSAPTPDALPPSIFAPGARQLTAPGFSQTIPIPPVIQLPNFSSLQSIDSTRDLTVTWDTSGYSPADVVTVVLYELTNAFDGDSWVTCKVPAAAGSAVVPASYLNTRLNTLSASVSQHPDQTPNFRLPQPDGSTLPLQFTYYFSETFPVTLH